MSRTLIYLLLAVCLVFGVIILINSRRGDVVTSSEMSALQSKSNAAMDEYKQSNIFFLPPETLRVNHGDLILRKNGNGWNVCKIKRFILQETLDVHWAKDRKLDNIERAFATADSRGLSAFAWICVVLQASPEQFPSVTEIRVNDALLKNIEASDEILVKAADVKAPDYALLK